MEEKPVPAPSDKPALEPEKTVSPAKPAFTAKEQKKSELKKEEAEKCLEEANAILREYGGLTSNIPINNVFWDLMNRHAGAHEEWKRLSGLNL